MVSLALQHLALKQQQLEHRLRQGDLTQAAEFTGEVDLKWRMNLSRGCHLALATN